ncbi:MAG: DUF4258 domain-containing protein [Leptospiraceae bacterium]|nr:DUF4258 domain-containing protein [Leptospiraceae bacterium]
MEFEFLIDDDTGLYHIEEHGISKFEIDSFFNDYNIIETKRSDGSFFAYGKTNSGRYLQVAYRKRSPKVYFIITAYDLEDLRIIGEVERVNEDY